MPKLTTGGRVTIPLRIRVALGLRPGDRVDFVKKKNGEFQMVPLINRARDEKRIARQKSC